MDKYISNLLKNRARGVKRYMDIVCHHLPLGVEYQHVPDGVFFMRPRYKQAVKLSAHYVLELLREPVDHKLLAMAIEDRFRDFEREEYQPRWKARRVNFWAMQNPPEGLDIEVYHARLGQDGYRGQVTAKTRNRNGTLLLTDVLPSPEAAKERCNGFARAYVIALAAFNGEDVGTELSLHPERNDPPTM
jgi:hypothetical protein